MRRASYGLWRCQRWVSLRGEGRARESGLGLWAWAWSEGRGVVLYSKTADTFTDVSHYCRFKGRTLVIKRYKGGWSYGDSVYYISVS